MIDTYSILLAGSPVLLIVNGNINGLDIKWFLTLSFKGQGYIIFLLKGTNHFSLYHLIIDFMTFQILKRCTRYSE
jgi:hypothetical protein